MAKTYTREDIDARFRELPLDGTFEIELGPDDRAYDVETGDTFLGGVTIVYSWGEFPGTARRAEVVP